MYGKSDTMRTLGYNVPQILIHLKIVGSFLSFLIIQLNNSSGEK